LKDAPNGFLLVRSQLDPVGRAGKGQVASVVSPLARGIELLVVDAAQLALARRVLPDPLLKPLLHVLELGLCRDRLRLIDDARLLVYLVIDDRAPQVQGVVEDVERVDALRAPLLR